MDPRAFFSGGSLYPVLIPFSGNFIAADSCYGSRTYGSAGNSRIGGISAWINKNTLATQQSLMQARGAGSAKTDIFIDLTGDNKPTMLDGSGLSVTCNTALASLTAWVHLVIGWDTTLATAADRVKFWVDGSRSAVTINTQCSQNYDLQFNAAIMHLLGARQTDGGAKEAYLNALLAAVFIIDGIEPVASGFGQLSPADGVTWVPKTPSLAYGTNGEAFDFADSGNLLNDVSGNNLDYATSGMSAANQSTVTPTNP